MRRYEVRLSLDAWQDMREIYEFIAARDGLAKADGVFDRLNAVAETLETDPQRGSRPRELSELGQVEYRQVFSKPYRLVYAFDERAVHVLLIADDRRDMRSLLAQRLLDA